MCACNVPSVPGVATTVDCANDMSVESVPCVVLEVVVALTVVLEDAVDEETEFEIRIVL
jgi:hypothetical protein